MNKIVQTFTTSSGDEGAQITNYQLQMSHYLTLHNLSIAMFGTRAHFKAKMKMWLGIIFLVNLIYFVYLFISVT